MYTPASNRESRPEVLRELIATYPFACLVSSGDDGPEATHLPMLLSDDGQRLRGHMARANDQWQHFANGPLLAIFRGPHAYISPTYYEAEFAVPTWNYVAVHATGTARLINDAQDVRELLDDLIVSSDRHGWTMPWQDERATGLLAAIVAFEIDIHRLEGKAKLGQNRSCADQQSTSRALATSARASDRELAHFMAEYQEQGSFQ
jgi:transcriptional regulator